MRNDRTRLVRRLLLGLLVVVSGAVAWSLWKPPSSRGTSSVSGVAGQEQGTTVSDLVILRFGEGDRPIEVRANRGWLRGILANRLKNFFRGRHSRPVATGASDFLARLDELEAPDSALSKEWDRDHDRHLAARAMKLVEQDFQPATWQAFRRLVLDGALPGEVAAELKLSVNAVLLAKSRVLKRLRSELGGFVDC